IILTFFALLLLLVLPSAFFVWMLGNDFTGLKSLLPWLAPGILMLVINIIISHYYSGSGKPVMALIGSGAGFVITLCAGYVLIPTIGLKGAAITATLSYFISSVLLLVIFMKQKKLQVKEFIPTVKDFLFWKEKLV
ncbi:MAG: lipopolysaccharide biosynthesis protein, partial [Bacteroidia bacterium]